MNHRFGETLPVDHYMLWAVGKDGNWDDIVKYFKSKYGYTPTEFSIGVGVNLPVPPGNINETKCQPGHIKVR